MLGGELSVHFLNVILLTLLIVLASIRALLFAIGWVSRGAARR